MASSPNWLQRYPAGQRDQVWAELRELGGAVRRPGLAQEAQLVCDEMARRARGEEGDDPVPFVSYLNDAFAHGGFPYGEYPWLPGPAAARSGSSGPSTRT
jgi:hypothetical protein